MANANLTFYSSIRQGAALAITRADVVDPPAPVIPRVQLPVTLAYPATAGETPATAGTTLSLLGPGDIVGLDTRTIVRTFPQANDNEAEAGFLCYVDFDQVDLPWRYMPAAFAGSVQADPEQSTDQIRPWLTLMVLVEGTDFDPRSIFAHHRATRSCRRSRSRRRTCCRIGRGSGPGPTFRGRGRSAARISPTRSPVRPVPWSRA